MSGVVMKDYIYQRVLECAGFIVQNNATIRAAAKKFCVSKSTVHKDVTERLREVDLALWESVRAVLEKNLAERHIRGGNATREKYLHK